MLKSRLHVVQGSLVIAGTLLVACTADDDPTAAGLPSASQHGEDPAESALPQALPASPFCLQDQYEPNDTPATASPLELDTDFNSGGVWVHAYLCSSNEDWYHVPASALGIAEPTIKLRAMARNAGLCGGGCDDVQLPSAPANTLTIEVYDTTGTTLLFSNTSDRGLVKFDRTGEEYANDFLVRVTGPAAAQYAYHFSLWVQDFDGEDECEC